MKKGKSYERQTGHETLIRSGLALGMGGIFEGKESGAFSKRDYVSVLDKSIDLGFTLVDTAPAYAAGVSEEIVGELSSSRRGELTIATKISPEDLDASRVGKSVEASLRRLKTDRIDLLQVHWPNPTVPLEETARAMLDLVEADKARWLGVANFSVSELENFSRFVPPEIFVSSQVEMSVVDRFEVPRGLRWAEENSRVTLAYSPLGKGRLAQNQVVEDGIREIAAGLGVSIPQLLLKWLASLGRVVPVVASRNLGHLSENLAALDISVGSSELNALEQVLDQSRVDLLLPSEITVAIDGDGARDVYQTLEDARANRLSLAPSPEQLAEQIIDHPDIKPVRVQRRGSQFFLIEGRVRYWAWVIAFGAEKKIPAIEVSQVVG